MSIKIPTFKDVQYLTNPTTLDTFVRDFAPQMSPDAERLFRETLAAVIDEATKPLILYVDGDGKPIDAPEVVHATSQHSTFDAPPETYVGGKDVEDEPKGSTPLQRLLEAANIYHKAEGELQGYRMGGTGTGAKMADSHQEPRDDAANALLDAALNYCDEPTAPNPSTAPSQNASDTAKVTWEGQTAPPADEEEWFNYPDVRPPYGVRIKVDFNAVVIEAYPRISAGGGIFYEEAASDAQYWCTPVRWRYVADPPKADVPDETDSDVAALINQINAARHTINELRVKLDETEMFRLRACKQRDSAIAQRGDLRAQLAQSILERDTALAQLDAEIRKHNDLRDSIRQGAAILTKALMD